MRAVRAALPVLLLLAACHCPGHVSIQVEDGNITVYGAALIEVSSESTPPITPGHSIRLPGKGVGTWKEISLSRPRGNNARYTDADRSSSNTFKASTMWITTLLVAWKSLSGIMNIIIPSR